MSKNVETSIDRRRLLLGLALASTAAVIPDNSGAHASKLPENPKLIALDAELPAVAEAYHTAYRAYREMEKRWNEATPRAPDEITELGIRSPLEGPKQNGEAEMLALGGYLYRPGEEFPRRIVVETWNIGRQIDAARRTKRHAKKNGAVADFLAAEEEIKRLKKFHASVSAYEAKLRESKWMARADHERLFPVRNQKLIAFARHVGAIMSEDDWTMEGLVIKAAALVEWNRVCMRDRLYASLDGADWHGSIAASILRHAERNG
ncbi:hypothetical protein PY650_35725 [Rhizobium calliandrae]|uniref:Uncharacterized protein n=1 Tax=Rhizobium calliandrae TaxID=1312182 RepID=A0ABT7KQB1_9HYPH|nr:hypothetical protein [Rhizobium calliandrae]MDL2410800.1 hypothetical protein [Rhizobium calliandrae]